MGTIMAMGFIGRVRGGGAVWQGKAETFFHFAYLRLAAAVALRICVSCTEGRFRGGGGANKRRRKAVATALSNLFTVLVFSATTMLSGTRVFSLWLLVCLASLVVASRSRFLTNRSQTAKLTKNKHTKTLVHLPTQYLCVFLHTANAMRTRS